VGIKRHNRTIRWCEQSCATLIPSYKFVAVFIAVAQRLNPGSPIELCRRVTFQRHCLTFRTGCIVSRYTATVSLTFRPPPLNTRLPTARQLSAACIFMRLGGQSTTYYIPVERLLRAEKKPGRVCSRRC